MKRFTFLIKNLLKINFTKFKLHLKQICYKLSILLPSVHCISSGAERLVKHLLKCKVPIALASGSFTTDFETKTQNHRDFFSLFEIKTLGDDPEVTHGKPNPEVFLVTARKFKDTPEPCSVLVFEDAPNGVIAAKSAGMAVVMVPDERMDSSMYNNADLVLGSLENFRPEDWGFPAFEQA